MNKFIFIIIYSFAFKIAFALNGDSSKQKIQVQVLPSAFYTPETSLGFGGILYSYFNFGKIDSLTLKSNSQTYISVSVNKQFSFENDYQIWLNKNKIYLVGSADYRMFPELFYGVGNETKENEKTMISFDIVRIHSKNLIKAYRKLYAGFLIHYEYLYNQSMSIKSVNTLKEIYGTMGYDSKGVGPIFIVDQRNNALNPSKGYYAEASYLDFKNVLNNQFKFTTFNLDLRKYHTFFKKLVWNGNMYFASSKGEVPYRMMPEIGGARFLRGYYRGRFRDNNLFILQHEFRLPIYKRIGIAAFNGIGSVAHNIKYFKYNILHYNFGVGLRLKINKKENTNIRIDYGFTKDSRGLYVVFAEAF